MDVTKKSMAIIGSGIAGMSAAYFLKDKYAITLLEKNDYIGGHTNTVYVDEDGVKLPIDTGFMVFNEVTYPNLLKLFKKLNVPYKNTDMSFGVRHHQSNLEYNGSNLDGLFAQRSNLISPNYYRFLLNINRFNKTAPKYLDDPALEGLSIKDFIQRENLSQDFYDKFLVPMSSAVWSTPTERMGDFPAKSLIRFFHNHGFLGLDTQHQWKTVVGGSESYKKLLIDSFKDHIKINQAAINVKQLDQGVEVTDINNKLQHYDYVLFACHADEVRQILENPTTKQRELLAPFHYQKNIAILHTDETVMPNLKKVWSAWNYIIPDQSETYTVYWMNKLQGVSDKKNYFININGENYVDKSKIIQKIIYHHPVFDLKAIKAQESLFDLNTEETPLYFCGSYFKYGFHEDALTSSVNLANYLLKNAVL
jgi:uncharacterized protein